jgi:hypothetical protein
LNEVETPRTPSLSPSDPPCSRTVAAGGERVADGPGEGIAMFTSLDAFRPMGERPPEIQIAEAQRREFFNQLHRWLRQDYSVQVFCNNDGERQRFEGVE